MARRLRHLMLGGGLLLAICVLTGCKTHQYIVPSPIIVEYEDPFRFPAGFLMSRHLRDQWFSQKSGIGRVDIPVGKVVLDFAKAHLENAFQPPEQMAASATTPVATEGFYTIRYYDRRSNQGILIKLNSIDVMLEDTTVYFRLNMNVEDASGKIVLQKDFYGKGVPEEGKGILQATVYKENAIELSTAAALSMIFDELLDDIGDLAR